jgi:predicted HTH domain antitoxin
MKALFLFAILSRRVQGFVVSRPPVSFSSRTATTTQLFAKLPEIDKMKASDMRKELEDYGISTKSLLEKSEFVEALKKARFEGKTSIYNNNGDSPSAKSSSGSSNESANDDKSSSSEPSRNERYKEAFEKAKAMKVGELKKELSDRGISTKSFFEKSEFIKAYAEVVADNKSGPGGSKARGAEEPHDPSYRDVVMQKMSSGALMGQPVIDVMLR